MIEFSLYHRKPEKMSARFWGGVIIICNQHKYCVPLSKPKKKHEKMRDKIDLIPVEDAQIQRIDTKIRKHDNMDTQRKKELLKRELEWCNEHARDLTNTANVRLQIF